MPGFSARLVRHAIALDTIRAEWKWYGISNDNSQPLMCGVTTKGVEEAAFSLGRLYIGVETNRKGIYAFVSEGVLGKKVNEVLKHYS